MSRKRQAIDIITVDEALSKSGMAQKVGGFAYLAEIAKNIPSAANIISYAKSINDLTEILAVENHNERIWRDHWEKKP